MSEDQIKDQAFGNCVMCLIKSGNICKKNY